MPVHSNSVTPEPGNSTKGANAPFWFYEDDVKKGIKMTAFLLLLVVSLLGNSLLIAVVYKNANQRMRTPSNYFIINMACADILLTVYCVPQNTIITAYQYRWLISGVAGELLCRLSFFIGQMSVLVSTGSIFIIALDRYFLVFYPLKRVITLRIARRVIGVVWILAIAFAAPLFRMASLIAVNPGFLVCTIDFEIIHYIIFYFLLFFPFTITLPLIATIAIYIAIGIKLNQTKPPGHQLPPSQERRERMNHKTLAMLLTIVALLMVFRFPMIIGMIACFSGSRSFCDHFTVMFTVWFLTYTNSGINPWIYFIFNEQFRQGARSLLQSLIPCCFKATNEVDVTETDGLQMTTHAPRP